MGRPVHDFRLLLEREDQREGYYRVQLYAAGNSPTNDARLAEQPGCPFDLYAWQKRWPALPDAEDALRDFGRELAALLLPVEVRDQFLARLIKEGGDTLSDVRLRLANRNPDFGGLPWEYLYFDGSPMRPELDGFLCRDSPCFHLVRQEGARQFVQPIPFKTLKVLVAWADPRSDLLAIREEIESVRATLTGKTRFELCGPIYCSTPGTLQQAIEDYRPHLLYFTGHGTKRPGGALLVGDRGTNGVPVSGEQLAKWLDPKTTALVVLSACDTEPLAQTLTRAGIPAVLAMQRPMPANLSSNFASVFWAALAEPCSLEKAVKRVRQATKKSEEHYWGVPTLSLAGEHSALFQQIVPGPFHVTPLRIRHFCGRESWLDRVHNWLMASDTPGVAVYGMGGLGKSQLAVEYAHRFRECYPSGVFWVGGRDAQARMGELAGLGAVFRRAGRPGGGTPRRARSR